MVVVVVVLVGIAVVDDGAVVHDTVVVFVVVLAVAGTLGCVAMCSSSCAHYFSGDAGQAREVRSRQTRLLNYFAAGTYVR